MKCFLCLFFKLAWKLQNHFMPCNLYYERKLIHIFISSPYHLWVCRLSHIYPCVYNWIHWVFILFSLSLKTSDSLYLYSMELFLFELGCDNSSHFIDPVEYLYSVYQQELTHCTSFLPYLPHDGVTLKYSLWRPFGSMLKFYSSNSY